MRLREKALYHQIHPAKLGTDILAAFASLYFLWQHQLLLGLAIHFAPPVLASALLVRFSHLDAQKNSALGRYVARHMTRTIELVRLAGDIVMVFGAWYHAPAVIATGLLIVLAAWASGPLRRRSTQ
jgi:cobalamin synthase